MRCPDCYAAIRPAHDDDADWALDLHRMHCRNKPRPPVAEKPTPNHLLDRLTRVGGE